MLQRLVIIAGLCALHLASGCKAGTTLTVPTPVGPMTVTYNGNAQEAFADLEEALSDCLNNYTEAVLAGDEELAGQWQDVIDQIMDAKLALSREQVPPGSLGSVS